jgi:sugar lactone lactonase YvrE
MNAKRNLSRYSLFTAGLTVAVAATICSVYLAVPNEAAPPMPTATITQVVGGLHNPRGLNFGPDGALYVVEAAANKPNPGPCAARPNGAIVCMSDTGSIMRIDLAAGTSERIIEGLPSQISANGEATAGLGANDISFQGLGNAYVTMGLENNPANRIANFGPDGDKFARLARFNTSLKFKYGEDLGEYEVTENPDGHVGPDANPYGVLALPGKVVYADASGNCLNQVLANGEISTLAVFPDRVVTRPNGTTVSVQAVPSSVALGPDGYYYVGQVTGSPFVVGAANVYRVPVDGGTPEVAYSGFTNIIDIAFAPDGTLYVLQISKNGIPVFNPGALIQILPDGTRTEIVPGQLRSPGGIAIGGDGALYVTNRSVQPLTGEVYRIDL